MLLPSVSMVEVMEMVEILISNIERATLSSKHEG